MCLHQPLLFFLSISLCLVWQFTLCLKWERRSLKKTGSEDTDEYVLKQRFEEAFVDNFFKTLISLILFFNYRSRGDLSSLLNILPVPLLFLLGQSGSRHYGSSWSYLDFWSHGHWKCSPAFPIRFLYLELFPRTRNFLVSLHRAGRSTGLLAAIFVPEWLKKETVYYKYHSASD